MLLVFQRYLIINENLQNLVKINAFFLKISKGSIAQQKKVYSSALFKMLSVLLLTERLSLGQNVKCSISQENFFQCARIIRNITYSTCIEYFYLYLEFVISMEFK